MAAIPATVADVVALEPALKPASINAATAPQFALIVDTYSLCAIVQPHWGTKLSEAHAVLAAHILTLCFLPANVGGVVTARSIDKIGESYAVGAFDDAELSTTKWGRLYLLMQKALRVKTSRAVSDGVLPPDFAVPDRRIL